MFQSIIFRCTLMIFRYEYLDIDACQCGVPIRKVMLRVIRLSELDIALADISNAYK